MEWRHSAIECSTSYRERRLWEKLSRQGHAAAHRLYSLEVSIQAYRRIFAELNIVGLAGSTVPGATDRRDN
jgi:hypothetical protein